MNRVVSAVGGACTTLATHVACARQSMPTWDRPSYRGMNVSLTGGLAVAAGTLAGAVLSGAPHRLPATIATVSGGVAGYIDDHLESAFPAKGKGFAGHLGALKEGKVTSGLMKIALVGTGALVSGALIARRSNGVASLADTAANTVLIATTANLVNLLDLRPGRALKVAGLLGAIGAARGSSVASGALGSALVGLPTDLAGETMLGDLGANAIGAALGTSLAADESRLVRYGATGVILTLTALSEKVSFSDIIDNTPFLKALDDVGRS